MDIVLHYSTYETEWIKIIIPELDNESHFY